MGTEKQVRRLSLTVPPERAGQKVDTLLRKVLGLSGTVIRRIKWLEDGMVIFCLLYCLLRAMAMKDGEFPVRCKIGLTNM